jgi:hypothetical protein
MKSVRALLKDRRRSQRGSVLSGVLIIVAFLGIISGALMTELSTNFLLTHDLVARVQTQATVSSVAELAFNQLQGAPLNVVCPPLNQLTVNGQTAVASMVSCAPVIDKRSPQSFTRIATSNAFRVDGTHAVLPGIDDYVVGDSGGRLYDYPLSWKGATRGPAFDLGGSVTGPPLVMPDPTESGAYLDLVPASGPSCGSSANCVAVVSSDASTRSLECSIPTGIVTGRPAMSNSFAGVAYFGDSNGSVTVYTPPCGGRSGCSQDPDAPGCGGGTGTYAIQQGPVVLPCSGCRRTTDEVYFVIASGGGNSQLAWFGYSPGQGFSNGPQTWNLQWGNATGIAVEPGGTRIVVSFQGGGVEVVRIDSNGNPTRAASTALPQGNTISGAPVWCDCPGPTDLIGVGGDNGSLYLLLPDANLQLYARSAAGARIRTTPAADGAGNWYVAPDDGWLYELQKAAGPTMTVAVRYGAAGAFRTSPVIGPCQQDICVYLASTDATAYLVDLDARDVVLTACLGSSSGCSGANPQLWTSVEIGVAGNAKAVHVQGWSYYSP